jgi:hypothetical protein
LVLSVLGGGIGGPRAPNRHHTPKIHQALIIHKVLNWLFIPGHRWLTSAILATQEADIRGIPIPSQPQENSS